LENSKIFELNSLEDIVIKELDDLRIGNEDKKVIKCENIIDKLRDCQEDGYKLWKFTEVNEFPQSASFGSSLPNFEKPSR